MAAALAVTLSAPLTALCEPGAPLAPGADRPAATRPAKPRGDATAHHHVGIASYYGRKFAGRTMADGSKMRPESDNAAHRTLPLGTTALVTNLSNGRSAVVTIRDRGPFVKGRIIDVSPRTASLLGLVEAGLARVSVMPLTLPPRSSASAVVVAAERDAAGPPGPPL